ncbi:hypothetical protein V1264_008404 [Littorina saxatilis]|uniref:Uncharacterized protein n=1 Tax=Littorina saxatilis TaxID=31220 RepID=A0AAN9ATG4_9CAEN
MGPKRDQNKDQESNQNKITSFAGDRPPPWAEKMEERIIERISAVTESLEFHAAAVQQLRKDTETFQHETNARFTEFEFHQRKYNLLFFGLKFTPATCEENVRNFMTQELELGEESVKSMIFQNCHPLPSRPDSTACIVRFVRFADKESVLRSLRKLKGKPGARGVSIRTDLPKELRKTRAELKAKMDGLKRETPERILRIAERGQEIRIEERKSNRWIKVQ